MGSGGLTDFIVIIAMAMLLEDVDIRLHTWSISCEKDRGCMISDKVSIKSSTFYPKRCMYYNVGLDHLRNMKQLS